ncbi:MarR family winged helix-turn-helix transcriptional regulator [Zhouia sp. PK063]|uniref:MarR family winged helix-turn-helix transcriptional regulator n=1 Tax=Zhouia sp. PK063 TaxID=3373602 RepID=UPI00378915EF
MKLKEGNHFTDKSHNCATQIICTANLLSFKMEEALQPTSLSLQQYTVLSILGKYKNELNVNILRSKLLDRQPNISRLLNKLSEKGLINKKRCTTDQRIVYIALSEKGKEMQLKAAKLIAQIVFPISDEKMEILHEILSEIRSTN